MNFSVRRTAAAVAACASAGTAAVMAASGAASATQLTPEQANALEQTVANMNVPFGIPLSGLVSPLLGKTSHAQVEGSLPASPLIPPTVKPADKSGVLPDPLVPALNGPHQTPSLGATAPLPDGTGRVGQDALGLDLPKSPLEAAGAALSLGEPLIAHMAQHPQDYTDGRQHQVSRSDDSKPTVEGLDLGDLDPALTPPKLHSNPDGGLSLDQRTSDQSLTKPVDGTLESVNGMLRQFGGM